MRSDGTARVSEWMSARPAAGSPSMSVLPVFPTHGLPRAAPALRQETPTVTELDAQIVVL
jgi:hypothetical protein